MSGNPFRVSQSFKQAAGAPAPHLDFINTANDSSADSSVRNLDSGNASSPSPIARTKKSVRIESPTSSPPHPAAHDAHNPLLQQTSQRRHAGSPPSSLPVSISVSFAEHTPTSTSRAGDRDHVYDSQGVTGSGPREPDIVGAVQSPSGAPPNPFTRTLASIGPQEKGGLELGNTAGQSQERVSAEKAAPGTPRTNMDVESFKRMLMTGITSPSSSGQAPPSAPSSNLVPVSAFESSSSTDTSSISRQSIFEPVQEPHVETPRTSYEMVASDDETVGLVTDVRKMEKKKPPPTPKHRHGKLVTSRAPQTVSFSDFSATQPTASLVTRNSASSDLNKPLPPPPILSPTAHTSSQDRLQTEEASASETRPTEAYSQAEVSPSQKRIPPPVPLARRQSQLRASGTGYRSRSNSSLTVSSQQSTTEFPLLSPTRAPESVTSLSSQKAPPPPPPARRHGNSLTDGNGSSTNSSSTELPSTTSIRRTAISPPNPPSSRKSTISSPPSSPIPTESSLSRAASTRSARNNSRNVSSESANMPPPPPPRRRQSGRTSLDKERPYHPPSSPSGSRRTSSENKRNSLDINRRASVASESSLKYEYAPTADNEHPLYSPREEVDEPRTLESMPMTKSDSSNILDDMEKFQREIDELRERYRTRN